MRKIGAVTVALSLLWVVSGCGQDDHKMPAPAARSAPPSAEIPEPAPPAAAPGPASTPQEAVRNWEKAIKANDQAAFAAVFELPPGTKEAMADVFPLVYESFLTEETLKMVYGKDATMAQGPTSDWKFEGADDPACYKIDGDKAVYTSKAGGKSISLVKIDGAWKIKLNDLPSADEAKALKKMVPIMVKVLKASREKIGKPGYTPERFNKELDEEMEKAVMATLMPPPNAEEKVMGEKK